MAIEIVTIKDASDVTRNVLADLIGSDYAQVMKLAWGADGVLTLVEVAAPLPVVQTGTHTVVNAAGSNLIGQVDLNSVPASARTTDTVSAALATDKILNNLTELTPKFAKANIAASTTDGALVALVAAKKLRVLSFRIHAAGTATNVTFTSKPAGAGTAISELFACGANGGRSEAFSPIGHFETAAGEGLSVTTGAGSTVGVGVTYCEV
jgi:hypothetical protein